MPYKTELLHLKLPRPLDRRVKYTEEDKAYIKKLFASGMPQRAIAKKTGISRRYISFTLFPERLKVCKAQFKERRKDGRYYTKEVHTKAVREWRRHRREHEKELI